MLNYSLEEQGNASLIRFEGDIGGADEPELKKLFVDLVTDGRVNAIGDMRKVSFVDSTVLGTLVWGMKNLRERDGDFRMYGLHDFLRRLFGITQLDRAFRIFETESDAVSSYD